MQLVHIIWFAIILTFAISVISGYVAVYMRHCRTAPLQIGSALANGVFLGAAFFHLLPSAISDMPATMAGWQIATPLLITVLTIVVLLLIEFYSSKLQHKHSNVSLWLLVITLSIHALITGAALGVSVTSSSVIILMIAILAHKGFETFALGINLSRCLNQDRAVMVFLALFSLITPIGIGLAHYGLQQQQLSHHPLTAYFNAIAAGTFIYIGSLHGVFAHRAEHAHERLGTSLIATLIGMVVMALIAFVV